VNLDTLSVFVNENLARARVIAGSAITLLTALAIGVTTFVNEVAAALPSGWQDNALAIGGTAVAWIGAAVAALRRVTPVAPEQRGVLPPS